MKIKHLLTFAIAIACAFTLAACDDVETTSAYEDKQSTLKLADKFSDGQSTPKDIDYSLERYNLIRFRYLS